MPYSVIPDDIRQFILDHIDSIAELEGLLIFRADATKFWSAESLARELYIESSQAQTLIAHLSEEGFLKSTDATPTTYHYHPNTPELDSAAARTAELYRQYLVPITHLIHSKPAKRIQQFADAFKLRKD